MNTAKTTPPILNGERREKVGHGSSGKCVFGRGQKGEVSWWGWGFLRFSFFFFFSLLSPLELRVRRLLPNWNVSCLLPPSHLYPRHRRLAPRHQRSSACPIPLSLESQGVLWRTKRKSEPTGLYSEETSRYLPLRHEKKKNLLFFVVFLSLQHFVIFENTQEHQRYFYSLLLFFFFFPLVICLEVKKEKKNWSWNLRQQSNK